MTRREPSIFPLLVASAAGAALFGGACFDFDGAFGARGGGGLGGSGTMSTGSTNPASNASGTNGAGAGSSTTDQASTSAGPVCTCKPPGHCEGATCVCPGNVVTEERFPTSAEGTNTGNKGWVGSGNILAHDGALATVTLDNTQTSELLIGHSFDFSDIPADATVTNVELRIYRCRTVIVSPVDVRDTVVQLVVGGVASGPNLSGAGWGVDCASPAQYAFDSGSFALSPAQLLGDFGAELRIHNGLAGKADANVDAMTLSVTYVPTCQ